MTSDTSATWRADLKASLYRNDRRVLRKTRPTLEAKLTWLVSISLLTCCCTVNVFADPPSIVSVAGTGVLENNGDTGPAAKTNIGHPFGIEIGADGELYITEVKNHRVRRLDRRTGMLSTVAGSGRRGYAGDGGLAVNAELNEPYEVRFDHKGNMYIVEMKNHVVRRVNAKSKMISTIAGTGRPGFGGDGGPAVDALLNHPHSIALDRNGAVYIADIGNHRIRRIDPNTGVIESVAGNSQQKLPQNGQPARGGPILGPRALYIHGDTLWIALREGHSIWRMDLPSTVLRHVAGRGQAGFDGDDGPAAEAAFNGPKGIAVGPNGDVFVVDSENNAIRKIDSTSGWISTVAGKTAPTGNIDSDTVVQSTDLNQPHGICIAADGTLFIGDTLNNRVLHVR